MRAQHESGRQSSVALLSSAPFCIHFYLFLFKPGAAVFLSDARPATASQSMAESADAAWHFFLWTVSLPVRFEADWGLAARNETLLILYVSLSLSPFSPRRSLSPSQMSVETMLSGEGEITTRE